MDSYGINESISQSNAMTRDLMNYNDEVRARKSSLITQGKALKSAAQTQAEQDEAAVQGANQTNLVKSGITGYLAEGKLEGLSTLPGLRQNISTYEKMGVDGKAVTTAIPEGETFLESQARVLRNRNPLASTLLDYKQGKVKIKLGGGSVKAGSELVNDEATVTRAVENPVSRVLGVGQGSEARGFTQRVTKVPGAFGDAADVPDLLRTPSQLATPPPSRGSVGFRGDPAPPPSRGTPGFRGDLSESAPPSRGEAIPSEREFAARRGRRAAAAELRQGRTGSAKLGADRARPPTSRPPAERAMESNGRAGGGSSQAIEDARSGVGSGRSLTAETGQAVSTAEAGEEAVSIGAKAVGKSLMTTGIKVAGNLQGGADIVDIIGHGFHNENSIENWGEGFTAFGTLAETAGLAMPVFEGIGAVSGVIGSVLTAIGENKEKKDDKLKNTLTNQNNMDANKTNIDNQKTIVGTSFQTTGQIANQSQHITNLGGVGTF